MGAPVVHFEVNAKDAARAQEFYSNLFGWKVDANNPMKYGIVNTGVKMGINGGIGQAQSEAPSSVTFYVQVENLQAYLDKAESLGGRTVMPPTEIPGSVTLAMFTDPEGNTIGMIKGPQTPPKKVTRRKKAKAGKKKTSKAKSRSRARRRRR